MTQSIDTIRAAALWGDLPLPDHASRVWLNLAGQYQARQQWPTSQTQTLHHARIGGEWYSVYLYADDGRVRMRASGDEGDALTVYLLGREGWQPAVIREEAYQSWYIRNQRTLHRLESDLAALQCHG